MNKSWIYIFLSLIQLLHMIACEDPTPLSSGERYDSYTDFKVLDLSIFDQQVTTISPKNDQNISTSHVYDDLDVYEQDRSIASPDVELLDMSLDQFDQMEIMPQCQPQADFCAEISQWSEGSFTQYPIVLVHGFMGWDQVLWVNYFYQIPDLLHQNGASIYVAELDPINHSTVRSAQLATFVDQVLTCSCSDQLNIIAHSQGGLDARFLIGPLGYQDVIASITTISTPHHGITLADDALSGSRVGIEFLELLASLFTWITANPGELEDSLRSCLASMSTQQQDRYNAMWAGSEQIPIYSYAGFTNPLSRGGDLCRRTGQYAGQRGDLIETALLLSYYLTGGRDQPNDGLIPVSSAIWGEFLGCIPADHFDQIGQILGLSDFDYQRFYLEHLQFLKERGH